MRGYLDPYLIEVSLAALTAGGEQAMFTAMARDEAALGHPVSSGCRGPSRAFFGLFFGLFFLVRA